MADLTVWQHANDNALIEHILARYHMVHRQQLADLLPLAEKVNTAHAGCFPAQILPLLQSMQAELLSHMLKEERVLFPMILNGAGPNATMPIRMMMHEHDAHDEAIRQLLALTDGLSTPAGADENWRQLYVGLRVLITDLHDHINLENTVLFARTLA